MSVHSMRVDQLHAELYEKMEEVAWVSRINAETETRDKMWHISTPRL